MRTAWASASTYRCTDHRGGANGARIRLAPQKNWAANDPDELAKVLEGLTKVQENFNKRARGKSVSLADVIVLGGNAAVEAAAKEAGHKLELSFSPGRTDATDLMTDADSFAVLEPKADGFRNHLSSDPMIQFGASPEEWLVDKGYMLTLSAPEMAVLVAGMRALDANAGGSQLGVFTDKPGTLTNDFFVNLLDMGTVWAKSESDESVYEGKDYATGEVKWRGSQVDLVFGSNAQLRGVAEYYACDDATQTFVDDFGAAWTKVMNLDRFDLA